MGCCHLPPGLQGICRQAVRRFEKICFKSEVAAVSLDHHLVIHSQPIFDFSTSTCLIRTSLGNANRRRKTKDFI
jgi:hypothetical protein